MSKAPAPIDANTPTADSSTDIARFLSRARETRITGGGHGGLVFALDATMSRQQTWDSAQHIQAQMFKTVEKTGGLDIQLVYFRGFGECRASRWVQNGAELATMMSKIDCRGGQTQIGKVLAHLRKEAAKRNPANADRSRVDACVYVGDAMEEDVDALCQKAGEIGLLGVPCFMFLEGRDAAAERAFREIARLTKGAFARFDSGAAAHLATLLAAVAQFASGGRAALERSATPEARKLLEQL
ncbi:MAG: VWA domain-containing protein [Ahrensia sp.]|nr:VWA domain-containing protein [Ahrensia sp.]